MIMQNTNDGIIQPFKHMYEMIKNYKYKPTRPYYVMSKELLELHENENTNPELKARILAETYQGDTIIDD